MNRRPLSLLLAVTLILSAAVTAFAAPAASNFDPSLAVTAQAVVDSGEVGSALPDRDTSDSSLDADDQIALDSGPAPFLTEQIQFPSELPFVIDPYERADRGQIYSNPFVIVNRSAHAVNITLIGTRVVLAEGSEIQMVGQPVNPLSDSREKELELYLRPVDSGRMPRIPLTEQPEEPITFVLDPGEETAFAVGGTLNPNPSSPWKSGEVRIQTAYRIEPIEVDQIMVEEAPSEVASSGVSS